MTGGGDRPRVLVVDDEQRVADLYARFLGDDYEVDVAYGGEAALELLDAEPDVVLLDRRMPELSGDEVLARLRERGCDARVAMVTAVEPDVGVVDLPFDDYLVKPVGRGQLRDTVEELLLLDEFDEVLADLSTMRGKRRLLELRMTDTQLVASDEYNRLLEDIADAEDAVFRLESAYADERWRDEEG